VKSSLDSIALTTGLLVLLGNVAVIITCLIAGPRLWSRRLREICLWATGVLIPATAYYGYDLFLNLMNAFGTPFFWLGPDPSPFSSLWWSLYACSPFAIEFLILLSLSHWRPRPSSPTPEDSE